MCAPSEEKKKPSFLLLLRVIENSSLMRCERRGETPTYARPFVFRTRLFSGREQHVQNASEALLLLLLMSFIQLRRKKIIMIVVACV